MLRSYWCPQRARHLAALITNYRANQSLLAMEQLSALHSIGEEGTSNPCSSVSVPPKITANASVVQRSYVKRRGTVICFLPNEPRSHYTATPSANPGIVGVDFHLRPIQRVHFCHYINLFHCGLCRLAFCLIESKPAQLTVDVTLPWRL